MTWWHIWDKERSSTHSKILITSSKQFRPEYLNVCCTSSLFAAISQMPNIPSLLTEKSRLECEIQPSPMTFEWCPCSSSAVPLPPPISHTIIELSKLPEYNCCFSASHSNEPILPMKSDVQYLLAFLRMLELEGLRKTMYWSENVSYWTRVLRRNWNGKKSYDVRKIVVKDFNILRNLYLLICIFLHR